jgi:hypothetical protein
MGTYDRYAKRLDLIADKIKAGQSMRDLEYSPEKLKNPTENIEYIYTLLSDNKIQIKLSNTNNKLPDLVDLGLEVNYDSN